MQKVNELINRVSLMLVFDKCNDTKVAKSALQNSRVPLEGPWKASQKACPPLPRLLRRS